MQPEDVPLDPWHVSEIGAEPHELVRMGTRAQPFVWMIRQAYMDDAPILWEAEADFFTEQ